MHLFYDWFIINIMNVFSGIELRGLGLKNRIVMSPMCMYSAEDGFVNDFHIAHYGSRAMGGTGLIFTEATAISPEGVISKQDLGIYKDEHIDGLKRIVDICHRFGAKIGIQLAHAGRKAFGGRPWDKFDKFGYDELDIIAPNPIPFAEHWKTPKEMTREDIKSLVEKYINATKRALKAGFDTIEIHAAHGYLLNEFLSSITNKRQDEYGGEFKNRIRLLLEITEAIRSIIPDNMPLFVRISVVDHVEGGWNLKDSIELAKILKTKGADIIDCSSGGIALGAPPSDYYRAHQIKFSEAIRKEANIKTIAIGGITSFDMANEIIKNERADLVAIARMFLNDPYLPIRWAKSRGVDIEVPVQYRLGYYLDI